MYTCEARHAAGQSCYSNWILPLAECSRTIILFQFCMRRIAGVAEQQQTVQQDTAMHIDWEKDSSNSSGSKSSRKGSSNNRESWSSTSNDTTGSVREDQAPQQKPYVMMAVKLRSGKVQLGDGSRAVCLPSHLQSWITLVSSFQCTRQSCKGPGMHNSNLHSMSRPALARLAHRTRYTTYSTKEPICITWFPCQDLCLHDLPIEHPTQRTLQRNPYA